MRCGPIPPMAARLVLVKPGAPPRSLTPGFASATDADVSFDGKRILFAGKKAPADPWCIYEMQADGTAVRKITCGPGEARHPLYISTVHTLAARVTEPWVQLAFVGLPTGRTAEDGLTPAANIYTCKFDGSALRPIAFSLSHETDPAILPDGRLVYSVWRAHRAGLVSHPRTDLLAMNLDGSDPLGYVTTEGRAVKQMPAVMESGLLVFVETDKSRSDGGGTLGAVSTTRNRHTYRTLSVPADGLFRAPADLQGDSLLVGWRSAEQTGTWGIYRFDIATKKRTLSFDDPKWDDIGAKRLTPRSLPDDRSSPVRDDDANGKFYGIDVGISDLARADWPKGLARRLRLLEGVPRQGVDANPVAVRRLLGEVPLADDGSFHVSVPANIPVELQLLDADGLALRSCAWIATRNHFNQGCIGCHEDPERTPPNRFVKAVQAPAAELNPPVDARRTMDYVHDVGPIVAARCVSCHDGSTKIFRWLAFRTKALRPHLRRTYSELVPGFVTPGAHVRAASPGTSLGATPHAPGMASSRQQAAHAMPAGGTLTDDDRRTILEWIDFGAAFDAKAVPALPSPSPAGDAR